jgi:dihydroorotase
MNEGAVATRLGLPGIPNAAESSMIARDVQIAALTKTPLHFAHVSTKESLAVIRQARAAGVKVTCEVTPHHLTLTDEAVALSRYDTNYKMNPPLRSEDDRQALVDALNDGTIDAIATDHAPHHPDEKALEFADAPFGIIGLETALPVLVDALLPAKALSVYRLVELLTTSPSRAFGLPCGTLAEGAPADVVIFSTENRTTFTADKLESKSRNTPWLGRTLRGRVERTFVGGREVYRYDESRQNPPAPSGPSR